MKNTNQYIPLAVLLLYLAVNIYLAALNWGIFSTVLNLELGFGKVAMPPFIFLFLFGLAAILALWGFEYRRDLKNQILRTEEEVKIAELKKDVEIERLKAEKIQQSLDHSTEKNTNKEKSSAASSEEKSTQ